MNVSLKNINPRLISNRIRKRIGDWCLEKLCVKQHEMEWKTWENIYGEFDKTDYEDFTLRGLPNEATFYFGEIIKWAQDIRPEPKRVLLAGENNNTVRHLQPEIGVEHIYTSGLSNVDYEWNYENDPPAMGSFDLIISQAMLEHLLNPYKHMCDLANLLTPGGYLIVHSVCHGYPYHRYPIDAFRFFPDWFEEIAKRLNLDIIKKRIKDIRNNHIFYMYQKPSNMSLTQYGEQLPSLKNVFCSVTDRCNLSCKMCPRKNLYYGYADIDASILQRVYDKAYDLHFVGLQGYGEPYLYKDLYKVIETLKALMPQKGEIGFNSNATLLERSHIVRTVESGLDNLTFSVDGATRATYERIRKGAKFGQIIKNIKDFVRYKKQVGSNHPKLMMNYVIMEDNIQEIPLFVELSKQCGINTIHFNYDRTSYRCLQTDELKEAFREANRKAKDLQVILHLPPIYPVKPENESCVFMDTVVLLNSGEVVPCCRAADFDMLGDPQNILSFGNVKENSLDDIWNSRSYISFRRQVLTKNWPRLCDGCGFKSQIFM